MLFVTMNILPKKSWHVRNKDNVARVRRDEENARLEEEKKADRAALAEQEIRTALLRSQAKNRSTETLKGEEVTDKALVPQDKPQHINFFADIEEGLRQGSNPEYEAEKKAEQEKAEKAIGLLTYLGQSVAGGQGNTPWYLSTSTKEDVPENNRESNKKALLDPLQSMKKHLKVKAQSEHKEKNRDCGSHRKHKRDKRDKDNKESKHLKSHKKSIGELRAERLKREKEEREKERQLLASVRGEVYPAGGSTSSAAELPQRYNSQFHPELARKPRSDSRRYKPY